MKRFPYLIPFMTIMVFLILCLNFSIMPALSGLPLPSPSTSPGSVPLLPADAGVLKEKSRDILRGMLQKGTYRERLLAADSLACSGEAADLYGLCDEALESGSVNDRMTVVKVIFDDNGRPPEEKAPLSDDARKIVRALLEDSAYVIQERTIHYLSLTGDPYWTPFFRKSLTAEDYYVRAGAVRALGRSNDKSVIPGLLTLMQPESGWTRLCFAQALARLGDERGVQGLLEASGTDINPKIRAYALGMRLETGDISVVPSLRTQMTCSDDRVSEIAGRFLSRFAPEEDEDIFTWILQAGDSQSVSHMLSRLKTFSREKRLRIFNEAYVKARDRRKILYSVFSPGSPDLPSILVTLQEVPLEEIFAGIVENWYLTDRDSCATFVDSLLSSPEASTSLKEQVLDVTGRAGEEKDLLLLEKWLSADIGSIGTHSAAAILSILSQEKVNRKEAEDEQ